MPNGKGFPNCHECKNNSTDGCRIHKFLWPVVSYEILCKDYCPAYEHSQATNSKIQNLETGSLYYYSYAWKPNYAKLGSLTELNKNIYQLDAKEHAKYEWILGVQEWCADIYNKSSIEIVINDNAVLFDKKTFEEEMAPTMSLKKIKHILSFESDKEKQEILKRGLLPATKKTTAQITAFVPKDGRSDILASFIKSNYSLTNYKKLKKRFPSLSITVFLTHIDGDRYEIKADLFQKNFILEEASKKS